MCCAAIARMCLAVVMFLGMLRPQEWRLLQIEHLHSTILAPKEARLMGLMPYVCVLQEVEVSKRVPGEAVSENPGL